MSYYVRTGKLNKLGWQDQWVIWYAAVFSGVHCAMQIQGAPTIEERLFWPVVVGLVVLLLGTWIVFIARQAWSRLEWNRKRAFKISVFPHKDARVPLKEFRMPVGTSRFLVEVNPRRRVEVSWFTIRFVSTASISKDTPNVPSDVISISQCDPKPRTADPEIDLHPRFRNDGAGGGFCEYHKPFARTADLPIRFAIEVDARKPWTGYLSFESDVGEDYRLYGRKRVIVEPSVWMMSEQGRPIERK